MMKLVLASNNRGKLAELQALFAGLDMVLISQTSLGVTEAEEPYRTFVENALTKARHASQSTGLPAIADDAGLCVDAFGGLPGVDTAFMPRSLVMKRVMPITSRRYWNNSRDKATDVRHWSAPW